MLPAGFSSFFDFSDRITLRFTQYGHCVEHQDFDARLGALSAKFPRLQFFIRQVLATRHCGCCQGSSVVAVPPFPSSALLNPNQLACVILQPIANYDSTLTLPKLEANGIA